MIRIYPDHIELRRKGERSGRTVPIEDLWALCVSRPSSPPKTTHSKNSIVAVFNNVRVSGASLWKRMDTGELLTEHQIETQGRKEGRPVIALFGVPNWPMGGGVA